MIQVKTLVFAAAVLCQLGVPAWMILDREWTLRDGVRVKFRVEPLDPRDAVLGRHVRFKIPASEVTLDEAAETPSQVRAYGVLELDQKGFGRFTAVRDEPPEAGVYLGVRVRREGKTGTIRLPFDRYYLPEEVVSKAGAGQKEALRSGKVEAHVTLRVHRGDGVIEGLYAQDTPVLDYLKARTGPIGEEGDMP